MKKTILLSMVCVLSIMIGACNDDDDDNGGNDPNPNPPSENADPSFEAIISGAITDTIAFIIPDEIVTSESINGAYVGVANLLSITAIELPTGFQFSIVGNKDSWGTGDFVATGMGGGFGAYSDPNLGRSYLGTASTITITSSELLQDLVQATYRVDGSFTMTLADNNNPGSTIQINGTFENIVIGVN
jgi:hypothetical protein